MAGGNPVQGNRHHDNDDRGSPVKIGGKAHSSAPTAVSDGDRVNAYFDTTGKLGIHDGGGSITVDGAGGTEYTEGDVDTTITGTAVMWEDTGDTLRAVSAAKPLPVSLIPGTGATNLGKAEDAAHTTGDTGVMLLAVRNSAFNTLTSTELDYSPVAVSPRGEVYIQADPDTPIPVDLLSATIAVAETSYAANSSAFNLTFGRLAPAGAVRNDNAATSFTDADGDLSAIAVDLKGRLFSRPHSQTSTVTAVADNAASVQLLAANTARVGAIITNDSSARLYIKLGTTASTTDYSVSLAQHGSFELPFGYTGRIDGIWATDPNDGAARITELT